MSVHPLFFVALWLGCVIAVIVLAAKSKIDHDLDQADLERRDRAQEREVRARLRPPRDITVAPARRPDRIGEGLDPVFHASLLEDFRRTGRWPS